MKIWHKLQGYHKVLQHDSNINTTIVAVIFKYNQNSSLFNYEQNKKKITKNNKRWHEKSRSRHNTTNSHNEYYRYLIEYNIALKITK